MKKSLTVGIISLFILSAIAPMSLGLDVKTDVVRESVSTSSYVEPMEHIWSMYKNDSRNTGCSIYNTSDNPGHEKWKYFVDRSLIGGVAIDKEGIIYVASSSNYDGLHAVYPNGTRKWKVSLDGYENQNPAIAPDGSIIVGTSRYLYSIYPNGTIKWKFSINSNFNCETVVDSNGIIYTATSDGIVYAIYANGTLKWEFYAADFIWYIALDEDENIYFGGPYSNSLFCLYPDGTLKWCYEFYYDMIGAPVIDDNGIIYAGFVHWLVALYPDGTEKWIVDFLENDWYGYPSIAPDGTIILSGAGDYVTALDPEDCSVIWQYLVDYRTDDFTTASISADGFIYFGYKGYENDKGYLCCLYPNGTLKWKTRLTTDYLPFNSVNIYCNPAIGADGTVYVTSWFIRSGSNYTNIGYIHAFEFADVIVDIEGPYYSLVGKTVRFYGEARWGYPPYSWLWDFGDGNTSDEHYPKYIYSQPDNFTVTLTVTDSQGNQSTDTTWAWIQDGNEPPSEPVIDGPSSGKVEKIYYFTFISQDPEGTDIWYYVDWDDPYPTNWAGPYKSGKEITLKNRWWSEGNYTIRCQAKDVYNDRSNWSEFQIKISNPRTRAWLRFVDMFPLLQRILNYIL